MHIRTRVLVLFALIGLTLFAPSAPIAQAALPSDTNLFSGDMLQFTSGGHILGFQSTGLYVTSGSSLLRLEFAATPGVSPTAAVSPSGNGAALPLQPVIYSNLWDGITVTFQPVAGGLYKSTYLLAPGSTVDSIRLRYNVGAEIDPYGNLTLRLPTASYEESAPIAWQEIDGTLVSVDAAFQAPASDEIGFRLGAYDPTYPLIIDPTLQWHTFLGSGLGDSGWGIAVDGSGNLYVVGDSLATWGSPRLPFNSGTGNSDAFVAKLSSSGNLVWNTFLGSISKDWGTGIALDSNNNIFVIGYSEGSWGASIKRDYQANDVFVAKLNNDGIYQWNAFLGSRSMDDAADIAVDSIGNIYAAGSSYDDWGVTHPRSYSGMTDGFVAKLATDGTYRWNSFVGGLGYDEAFGITVDNAGNTYVAGRSDQSWGSMGGDFSTANYNAFVAKFNSDGTHAWNTFFGSPADDRADSIAVDGSGNIYVLGASYATWGQPRDGMGYSGFWDMFVAKLTNTGMYQWHSFLGGSSSEMARTISVDASGNLYVIGYSGTSWGSPIRPYTSNTDAVESKLSGDGYLLWNAFWGGSGIDNGMDSVVDGNGNIYVIGTSNAAWGTSPLEAFHGAGTEDAFVAMIRKDYSTTSLTADMPDPSLPGQSVTVNYTVSGNPSGVLTPTGLVTVSDGAISCSGTVAVGHCALTFANAGTRELTATYAGNTDFAGSSSAAQAHTVNRINTTTTITAHNPTTSVPGQTVTVYFTVAATTSSSLTPSGVVTVSDGTTSCSVAVTIGHCDLTFASVGTRNLAALYSGDANFNGSSSAAVAHQVSKANTAISITGQTPIPSAPGQSFTVSWAVSVAAPATGTPTGNVTIGAGTGNSCTAAVGAGKCSLVVSNVGDNTVTATYAGDAIFNGSSTTATHTVRNGQYFIFIPFVDR